MATSTATPARHARKSHVRKVAKAVAKAVKPDMSKTDEAALDAQLEQILGSESADGPDSDDSADGQ